MKHAKSSPSGFSLVELVIVVAILGILAAITIPKYVDAQGRARVTAAATTVRHVNIRLSEHYAMQHGFPSEIEDSWFVDGLPANPYASSNGANIENVNTASAYHPADKTISDTRSFWYNHQTGSFRALVPSNDDAAELITLYNTINGANVTTADQTGR